MIYIIAGITSHEDKIADTLQALQLLQKGALTEQGNHGYLLHQSIDEPNLFMVYETYENDTAIAEHSASDHFQSFVEKAKTLLSKPIDIKKLNKI